MGSLQEGIYFDEGQTPGRCYSIVFLRARQDTPAGAVGELLTELWRTYGELKAGRVRDLPGVQLPSGELTVLVGYGPKAFALRGVGRSMPASLGPANQFRSMGPGGGNPILPASKLRYATGMTRNLATEEVALQFIAATPLAANRPVVETWKVLQDNRDPATGQAALSIAGVFSGFNREDHRSWIDFHDGVSNLRSGQERRSVIETRGGIPRADSWTVGGTSMVFVRLLVDLARWRQLTRAQQELVVGRDKLTGCALVDLDTQGQPRPVGGCPMGGTVDVIDAANHAFRQPPQGVSEPIQLSHVQRANRIKNTADPGSARVFRQGYEFLSGLDGGGNLLLGLNFVSFQDTPKRVIDILSRTQWLREVNFGGDSAPGAAAPGAPELLSVQAAGIFLVPPVEGAEPFPGSSIFFPRRSRARTPRPARG